MLCYEVIGIDNRCCLKEFQPILLSFCINVILSSDSFSLSASFISDPLSAVSSSIYSPRILCLTSSNDELVDI